MKRFKNILYVNETGVNQSSAIARAVSLAKHNQADLTIVDVIDGPSAEELKTEVAVNRRRALAALIAPFQQGIDIQIQVLTGKRFLEVIRMVLSQSFDLVVKPAEDPDWMDRLFGSDDMHLLLTLTRSIQCPKNRISTGPFWNWPPPLPWPTMRPCTLPTPGMLLRNRHFCHKREFQPKVWTRMLGKKRRCTKMACPPWALH